MEDCHFCGNPVPKGRTVCPYCQSPLKQMQSSHKPIIGNLEDGMPTVEEARVRMRNVLAEARNAGVIMVKFIHGYGSSGKGGAIREGVRRSLAKLARRGEIKIAIHGERFGPELIELHELHRSRKQMENDSDFGRYNPGITIVILN
jgi:hypothetical protein